jgi:hypothetical protein
LTVYVITSCAALRANIIGLSAQVALLPALLGSVIVVTISKIVGSHFRRLAWTARAWVAGGIIVLPFALAALWIVFWQKHGFGGSYLHPIVGPAAVLAAALFSLPFELAAKRRVVWRWIPTAASLVATVFLVRPLTANPGLWSFADGRALAGEMTRHGWSYEDLVFHLQSRECRDLLTQVSVFAPPPNETARRGRRSLQVLKARRDVAVPFARLGDVIPLQSEDVLVVREVESWLQPASLKACRLPTDARPALCEEANLGATRLLASERFMFATRSFPEIHRLDLPPPYIARYEVPISPLAGESRQLLLTDDSAPGCGWRITRVDGVRVDGPLPARVVRLHSDSGEGGLLVFERPFGTAACPSSGFDRRYPPCLFESQPGDPLAALVGAG